MAANRFITHETADFQRQSVSLLRRQPGYETSSNRKKFGGVIRGIGWNGYTSWNHDIGYDEDIDGIHRMVESKSCSEQELDSIIETDTRSIRKRLRSLNAHKFSLII